MTANSFEATGSDGSFYFQDLDEQGQPWHRIPARNRPLAIAVCGLYAKTVSVQTKPRLQEVHCGSCFDEKWLAADTDDNYFKDLSRGRYTGTLFDMSSEIIPDKRKFAFAGMSADDVRMIYFAIRQHIDTIQSDLNEATGEDRIFDIEELAKLTRWQVDLETKFGGADILSFG
jgi:hypothetical protein